MRFSRMISMFEKKRYLEQHGDDFRRFMLREPRGNPAAMVNLVLPPVHPAGSAQVATLHARGRVAVGDELRQEGILDTIFTARIVGEARVGAHAAIVPTIRGRAWISAFAQYVLAPDDPFPEGFMVGDVWPM